MSSIDGRALVGNTVLMKCDGNSVKWYKSRYDNLIAKNAEIRVTVQLMDGGSYYCVGQNNQGALFTAYIYLKVYGR